MLVQGLAINSPIDLERLQGILARLELAEDSTLLDVGCGRGLMLAMAQQEFGCSVIGVDPKSEELSVARTRLEHAGEKARLVESEAAGVDLAELAPDAALCIGATHAFGSPGEAYRKTLEALAGVVPAGGRLLVGEGYWRRVPDPAYLEAAGLDAGELSTHEENIALAEELGLTLLDAWESSQKEWDEFEGLFWAAAEAALERSPEDAAVVQRADHWRRWKAAYLTWGRDTMGFGLYLLQTPS